MAVMTFSMASGNSREIYKQDADYSTARNAATGTLGDTGYIKIGQIFYSPNYTVYRETLSFDTSGLDDNALIKSAYLTGSGYNSGHLENKIILIKNGMPTYPHTTPEVGDFDIDHYSGNGGEATVPTAEWNTIKMDLNATGLSWINKEGWTKFIVISEDDNNEEPPVQGDSFSWYGYSAGPPEVRIQLVVTYYLPSSVPLVQSVGPCIDRQSTTMTAVGNVTDDGGGYEERGFEYYEDATGYDVEMYAVRELGVFTGTGNFEMTINGLKPETTYQIRAWVRNSYGTSYGEWYTCTTTAVPSYSIYTESNDANYKLYLSDDEAIAWQGYRGPFNGKQKDINVTDLVNKTPGVKVLKLVSDARGTFHITITVKQNIKS